MEEYWRRKEKKEMHERRKRKIQERRKEEMQVRRRKGSRRAEGK